MGANPEFKQLATTLFIFGGILLLLGGLIFLFGKVGFPLGKLPGDLSFKGKSTQVYFPIVTSIIVSILLTIILNAVLYFFRK